MLFAQSYTVSVTKHQIYTKNKTYPISQSFILNPFPNETLTLKSSDFPALRLAGLEAGYWI